MELSYQRSFVDDAPSIGGGDGSKLYVVATPIGNLADITSRALDILQGVDLIVAEDTRRTRKLLSHYGLHTPLARYDGRGGEARILEPMMSRGHNVALVTDAGTPTISDPGNALVRAAVDAGIRVVTIPGPCAMVAALAASGLATHSFLFGGFLPRKATARCARLQEMQFVPATLVFYESPQRLLQTLSDIANVLGDRPVAIARELTKYYETWWRGPLSKVMEMLREGTRMRGECTIVVEGRVAGEGPPVPPSSVPVSIEQAVREELALGKVPRQAFKDVARRLGLSRREVYQRYHGLGIGRGEEDDPEGG
ncbi:16S rRNA (cytidine(1402)-2'-O)-methyltransferase [Pasteuria penetrans]|uniref:16S rRNA (cytidine(1402)-2'-O)-methyltransferase n=1 Tax=Pasteuria penetrans TaxID=86005 RepID=UPI000FA85A72|nr:16S rRNA (cytidine(1402)-2'-O)-methyltransferase [Pasteuria penetrans]